MDDAGVRGCRPASIRGQAGWLLVLTFSLLVCGAGAQAPQAAAGAQTPEAAAGAEASQGAAGAAPADRSSGSRAAGAMDHVPSQLSDGLTVSVNGRSVQLSVPELESMPQTAVTVHNAHAGVDEQYTGVALSDLFAKLGVPQEHGPEQARLLHSYVRAQGTDNYYVIFSALEVDHELHAGNVLVALRKNGQPLGQEGRLKLVSTEDALPARSVRNLNLLTLSTVN